MKKRLSLIPALTLAALLVFSLTACDIGGLLGSQDGKEVALEYDYEKMEENLAKLKKEDGLLIEMTVVSTETGERPESATITYAESADAFFYSGDGTEIMFDFSDDTKCVTYEKQSDGSWTKYDTVYEENGITREHMETGAALYTVALTGYLGNYAQFAGQMMTASSDKVAGRDCDKFTYSLMFLGYGVEYNFSVDRETGMCLKWEMSAAAGVEGSATVEYTCTRFESPYVITFPENAVDVTESDGSQGGSEDGDPSHTPSETRGESGSVSDGVDINAILSGSTSVVYGHLTDAEKQAVIDEARKEGVDISFGADGSMTVVDRDGSVTIQRPDGSWAYQDEDGNVIQIGGNEWPSNEFTELLPKPAAGTVMACGMEGNSCTILMNWSIEEARAYAEAVLAAGFSLNASDVDMMGIYSFNGTNADGVSVSVSYAEGSGGIVIDK